MRHRIKTIITAATLVGVIGLSGCFRKPETSCSSQDSLDATTGLIKQELEKEAIAKSKSDDGSRVATDSSIRAAINLLKITIEDIRTTKVDPNSTKKFCTGTAKVVFPLNVIGDADHARSVAQLSSVDSMAEAANVQRAADAFTFPMDFDVQPTDDKKSVYSESDDVGPQLGFFSDVLMFYLAKSKIETRVSAQQQAAQQQLAEQQAAAQQAVQATLESARSDNKLAAQTINATWAGIDATVKEQILDNQRTWVKAKTANCNVQAASASTDPNEREIARLKCDAQANQARTEWLKQYLPKPAE
jgi:hypothetical protein